MFRIDSESVFPMGIDVMAIQENKRVQNIEVLFMLDVYMMVD